MIEAIIGWACFGVFVVIAVYLAAQFFVRHDRLYKCSKDNIDKRTGLPQLPKHYYWNVRLNVGGYSRYRIQIKHRVLGIPFEVDDARDTFTSESELVTSAKYALGNFRERYARKNKTRIMKKNPDNILGNYPPKKVKS